MSASEMASEPDVWIVSLRETVTPLSEVTADAAMVSVGCSMSVSRVPAKRIDDNIKITP